MRTVNIHEAKTHLSHLVNRAADTHVLLWAVGPDERLSATARQLIGDPDNEVCFSTVSIWEVAIKHGRGRATSR
jgi:PIN domain nuclease of toxin-antitoxin system